MQITETKTDGLRREFKVVIAAADIEQSVTIRLKEIGRSLQLPGFRPGEVPLTTLKQHYGSVVLGEVLERTINDITDEALRAHNFRPVLQPKVDIINFGEGIDFAFRLAVEVLPDIQAMDFGDLRFERLKPELSEEEIHLALERVALQQRKSALVEREAQIGDAVLIDFEGTIDGKEFPGSVAEGYLLELGSRSFIPAFEDQLQGVKAGETRGLTLTFPADHGARELAGKTGSFEVKVREVRALQPQSIDDSLAQAVGLEKLDDLRQSLSEQIERDHDEISRQRLKQSVLDRLVERYKFPVPMSLVEIEFAAIWRQYELERAALRPPEREPPADPINEMELRADYRDIAERRVRLGLILSEVGRSHHITVTADEINGVLTAQAQRFPGQERRVIDYYRQHPEMIDHIRAPIFEDKVINVILERAQVSERRVPLAELQRNADETGSPAEAETKLSHQAVPDARKQSLCQAEPSEGPKKTRRKKSRKRR